MTQSERDKGKEKRAGEEEREGKVEERKWGGWEEREVGGREGKNERKVIDKIWRGK